MIAQQISALDMEALMHRMKKLELTDRVITLLNQMWNEVCRSSTGHRIVEVNMEEDGMEVIIGELRVPNFYFYNEKKFWSQLHCILKFQVRREDWLKVMVHQQFVSDGMKEPFAPWYWKSNGKPTLKQ